MSLVNYLKTNTKIVSTIFLCIVSSTALFAEQIVYKLAGENSVLVKGLGEAAENVAPETVFPRKALVSTADKSAKIQRINSSTEITLKPESIIENMNVDYMDTPQWFFYRGEMLISNSEPILIKAGMAELLIYPGKTLVRLSDELFVKSIEGGLMLSTPSYVEGVKAGQEARVNKSGRIKHTDQVLVASKGPTDLEDRYKLLGLKYKNVATSRVSLFNGLRFADKKVALASMKRLLARHDWTELLEKGREQLFVQELIGLENEMEVLPVSMKKHFYDKEEVDALFSDLAMADKEMSQLNPVEKDEVVFFIRQKMTDPLLSRFDLFEAFKYKFSAVTAHDSNVAQNPDTSATATNASGMSLATSLGLDFQSRNWKYGQSSAKIKISDTSYFNDAFETRAFSKIGSKVNHVFHLGKKSVVSSIIPSLGYDMNYLNTSGSRRFTYWTVKPRVDFVFRPVYSLFSWSDLMLFYVNVGVDFNTYSVDKLGSDGANLASKDSSVLNGSLIAVSYDKWGSYNSKMVAVLSSRSASSDAGVYEYDNHRFDYIFSLSRNNTSLEPSIAYSYRSYDSYLRQEREDDVIEYGIKLKHLYEKTNTEVSIGYRHTARNSGGGSNAPLYTYDNNRVSGAVHVKF